MMKTYAYPQKFSEIDALIRDPLTSEISNIAWNGLLCRDEIARVLGNWSEYREQSFLLGLEDSFAEEVKNQFKKLLEPSGWRTEFHEHFPRALCFRHWFDDNLTLTRNELIWGEELGVYILPNRLVMAKSIIRNTHLVYNLDTVKSLEASPYITGGYELFSSDFQVTTREDITERFGVTLPGDTVVLVK